MWETLKNLLTKALQAVLLQTSKRKLRGALSFYFCHRARGRAGTCCHVSPCLNLSANMSPHPTTQSHSKLYTQIRPQPTRPQDSLTTHGMVVGQRQALLHTGWHIIYVQRWIPAIRTLDSHGGRVIYLRQKSAVTQVLGLPEGMGRAEKPHSSNPRTILAKEEKAQLPEWGQAEALTPNPSPNTYLLAILAGKRPPNRGHIVDVLGPRG